MKSLKQYLTEDGCSVATPGNTMGMGNPMSPSGDTVGTEPLIPTAKTKKEKKHDKKSIIKQVKGI